MENPEKCGFMGSSEGRSGEFYQEGMMPPGGMMPPPGEMPTQMSPEQFEQYQQYQNQNQDYQGGYQEGSFDSNYQAPPPPTTEPQPTSYDHSRSLLSNVLSAFLAPFR